MVAETMSIAHNVCIVKYKLERFQRNMWRDNKGNVVKYVPCPEALQGLHRETPIILHPTYAARPDWLHFSNLIKSRFTNVKSSFEDFIEQEIE